MEMDDDPDPEPPTGTQTHPMSISSGSPYEGSPYQGPDSWAERWNTYQWEYTPSFHNSPPQTPLEEPYLQAVTPLPLPVEEPPQQPPQPPPEPPRRRRNARMSVRGGPRFSPPQASSTYRPIPEDPRMGGPSHAVPEMIPRQLLLHHRHRQWYTQWGILCMVSIPPYQQQPPPSQIQTQQILQRLDQVEQKAEEHDKKHNKFLKGLANLINGKKK
ncbi:extensin-like [Helianthus annuus]|uniref:extensin-like n=1 Tax=Helianthus annuus TaxID=4232 RepID=UPI000B8F50FA|nr:extensin-like [Helianthus annuus]